MIRSAELIFDLEDRFARERGVRGRHPRPLGEIRIEALAEWVDGRERPLARPRRLLLRENPSGFLLFFGHCESEDGFNRQRSLAAGTYRMRVVSDFHQPVERDNILTPQAKEPYSIDLEPSFRYPFPRHSTLGRGRGHTLLRGSLRQADGQGIADSLIHVEGASYDCRTDGFGQWVLVFPDDFPTSEVTVELRFPDGRVQNIPRVAVAQGAENIVPAFPFSNPKEDP